MSGSINYDLHERAQGHARWLSAHNRPQGEITDRTSLRLLKEAAKNPKKVVHVEGTIAEGATGSQCYYVKVTRVTPSHP